MASRAPPNSIIYISHNTVFTSFVADCSRSCLQKVGGRLKGQEGMAGMPPRVWGSKEQRRRCCFPGGGTAVSTGCLLLGQSTLRVEANQDSSPRIRMEPQQVLGESASLQEQRRVRLLKEVSQATQGTAAEDLQSLLDCRQQCFAQGQISMTAASHQLMGSGEVSLMHSAGLPG